jgi:uncharacterized membrane protein YfcA
MPKQSSSSSSFPLHKVHITAKKPKMALYIIGAIPMAAMGAGSGGFIGNVTGNTIGSAILTVIGAVMLARPVIKAAKD